MKSCTVTNCGAKHYSLGLCRLHYQRTKEGKHGLAALLHVDHVLPLKGKLVSGLHVLENLQYLEPLANRQKLNRFVA